MANPYWRSHTPEKRHFDGDTAEHSIYINKQAVRNYRNEGEEVHCRCHHMHKGICPICPMADAIDEMCGDALTWIQILKLNNLDFVKCVKPNETYYWKLVQTSKNRTRRLFTTL